MGVRLVLTIAILLGCGLSIAHAEEKPWAAGVSKEQQKKALALYTEGNGYFEQDLYAEALKRFETALSVWDHPAIRYNAALSAKHLDQIEHAYEHLTQALRFGAAPFTADLYQEALRNERLLGAMLGEIEVTTQQPLEVTLDGKLLLDRPGSVKQRVRTGSHQIVATRTGYLTDTRTIELKAGTKETLTFELKKPARAPNVRRWSQWKPYGVLLGGALISGAGAWLYFETRSQYAAFDLAVAANPKETALPPPTQKLQDTANGYRAATVSVLTVGGVVVVTGIALVIMNQPRPGPTTTITPQVGSDSAGLVISGSW